VLLVVLGGMSDELWKAMSEEVEIVSAEQHSRETGLPLPEGWVVARLKKMPGVAAAAANEELARLALKIMLAAAWRKRPMNELLRRHHVN